MSEVSPAVDRAAHAARELAARRGDSPRLGDWMTGLLQEEWGRPAELLGRLGLELEEILPGIAGESPVAPDAQSLFTRARQLGLALRGESELTTDLLLLAVLSSDDGYRAEVAQLGLEIGRIEAALRADAIGPEEAPLQGEAFVIADAPGTTDAARIVDVNLNRARESFRVLDDYARFVLNDAFLTARFKQLRHRLVEASAGLPQHLLLGSRDTRADVGTGLQKTGAARDRYFDAYH